jgi:hypothetical protein
MEFVYIIMAYLLGGITVLVLFSLIRTPQTYAGSIIVDKEEEKTIYTLALDDDPENLQFAESVVFKVVPFEENLNRE